MLFASFYRFLPFNIISDTLLWTLSFTKIKNQMLTSDNLVVLGYKILVSWYESIIHEWVGSKSK